MTPFNNNESHTWVLERKSSPPEFAQENPQGDYIFYNLVIALSGPNNLLYTVIK
jgi:hypothetical protein